MNYESGLQHWIDYYIIQLARNVIAELDTPARNISSNSREIKTQT